MTVPGRVEAASLLLSLDPPTWFVRHARAVAEVAALAGGPDRRAAGSAVDRRLVEAAALLHDVDKALPADDPARALPHGEGSAAWLTRHGHPELARAVAGHPVTRLLDGEAYPPVGGVRLAARSGSSPTRTSGPASDSSRWTRGSRRGAGATRRRAPRRVDGWDEAAFAAVRARAGRLEADVCRAAGVAPAEVRRLRLDRRRDRGGRETFAAGAAR